MQDALGLKKMTAFKARRQLHPLPKELGPE
jgi:hypothetical protein